MKNCLLNSLVATVLGLILATPTGALATTYYVPDDFATIRAAIDAATNGDAIIVRDGVYTGSGNKNLSFGGKAVLLRSENGSTDCVIDCEHDGRAFAFTAGEPAGCKVDGFTVLYGYVTGDLNNPASGGGAIQCIDSSPTIANCWLQDNESVGGGAVFCYDSSPDAPDSFPVITGCVVTSNSAVYSGGGIHIAGASPTIESCVIRGNSAGSGGGVGFVYSSGNVSNCEIYGNSAAENGGGVAC